MDLSHKACRSQSGKCASRVDPLRANINLPKKDKLKSLIQDLLDMNLCQLYQASLETQLLELPVNFHSKCVYTCLG